MERVNNLDLELPYPLPYSRSGCSTPQFKDQQWWLFSHRTKIGIPNSVGALLLFLFLEVQDIVKLALVSKTMLCISQEAMRFKYHWRFMHFRKFSFSNFNPFLLQIKGSFSLRSLEVVNCKNCLMECSVDMVMIDLLQRVTDLTMIESCTSSQLASLLTQCGNLKRLKTDMFSDDCVVALPKKSLRELFLIGCKSLTISGFSGLYSKLDVESGFLSICFESVCIESRAFEVLASTLEIEVEQETKLDLSISECSGFCKETAKIFFNILSQNRNIKFNKLKLNNGSLNAKDLNILCSLSELDVKYLDFQSVEGSLKILSRSNETLKAFAIAFPSNLKLMYVSSIFACKNLERIKLAQCSEIINDNFLLMLSTSNKQLQEVNFSACNLISNEGVKYICRGCKHITSLDLSRCELLDDCGLEEIVIFLGKRLRKLNLEGCHRLSSTGVVLLAKTCLNLEFLDISWCFQLKKEAIRLVAMNCRKLSFLCFDGLSQISDIERDTIYQLSYKLESNRSPVLRRQKSAPKMRTRKQRSQSVTYCDALTFTHVTEGEETLPLVQERSATIVIENKFLSETNTMVEHEEIVSRSSLFKLE